MLRLMDSYIMFKLLVFKNKGSSVDGVFLNRVTEFRYQGHLVTGDLNVKKDIERERRALVIRCNMMMPASLHGVRGKRTLHFSEHISNILKVQLMGVIYTEGL
ncbi:jg24332 [Pararge aegeria aegeria]|uniref:Jg24332 protein n=1 Tax=Pararge aegeria aegeria TaxID=348720 RepID=A0A8S4SIY3_9NEOP|nr:jg24332 [Pararge aegeria aegeria]